MKMVRVILLGSFAGNNAGDMVVLESVINDFQNIFLSGVPKAPNSIFEGWGSDMEIQMVIPTLNDRGLDFIYRMMGNEKRIKIMPVPIDKNPIVIMKAVRKLLKEFARADYIYTTAGILFDQKIWNPLYNFVIVYTPLLLWAKAKNSNVKIIGYNVGIITKSKTIGRVLLKKCIRLHDRIYLREERDIAITEQFRYRGEVFVSADNVFGHCKPRKRKNCKTKKLYINLTSYGVSDKRNFVKEITKFIAIMKSRYDIYFFQTSKRDLGIAKEISEKVELGEDHIFFLGLMGYNEIQSLLSDCELLVGMRMHSLIFALKQCCPIIAIGYSTKVSSLMRDICLEDFLIDMKDISAEMLKSKAALCEKQWEAIANQVYAELERRYDLCNSYK